MSTEDDMDREPEGEPPAEGKPPAEGTPPAAKKRRSARRSAKKPAVEAASEQDVAAAETPPSESTPARAKRPARKKPAGKTPTAAKTPAKEPAAAEAPAEPDKQRAPRAAKGAKPAPRRRVVRAHARYVRTSARKARMVCGHLRGKSVQEARAILAFTPREVARDWSKLLESAVANAESNHELLQDELIVREAYADEGPTIKRFRPRAMGRATPIRKRTSHLTIALTPDTRTPTTKR
jgi:ribosomal protein L22